MKAICHILNKVIAATVTAPFMLCVIFLRLLGRVFHLSYKEISVVFNLWVQGVLLMVSGIIPFAIMTWHICVAPSWHSTLMMLITAVYASIYILCGYSLYHHYKGPKDRAFDLCVNDLMKIGKLWHMSYYAVNLIIFVFWWLVLVCINVTIAIQVFREGFL